MSTFVLKYKDKDKVRRRTFASYYEAIVEKNKLREKGVCATLEEEGTAKIKKLPIFNSYEKNKLLKFIDMANKVGDLHNKKSYDKIKNKIEKGNKWTSW